MLSPNKFGAKCKMARMTDSKCREGPGKEVAVVATVATGAGLRAGFVRRSGTREGSVGLIWHLHSCSLQKCPILKSKSLPLYFIPTYVKYSSFHRPECQLNFRKLLRWLSPAKLEFLRLWRKRLYFSKIWVTSSRHWNWINGKMKGVLYNRFCHVALYGHFCLQCSWPYTLSKPLVYRHCNMPEK